MKSVRVHTMLLAFMSAFLFSGTVNAFGAMGSGMNEKGAGRATDGQPVETQEGKMLHGETTKDSGMKAEEMKKDDRKQDEGAMMKEKGIEKESGMMKGHDMK